MPAHTHSLPGTSAARFDGALEGYRPSGAATGTTGSAGSGAVHNNMQPTLFLNFMMKL